MPEIYEWSLCDIPGSSHKKSLKCIDFNLQLRISDDHSSEFQLMKLIDLTKYSTS